MKSKYFTTSDGTEFYAETNAINHARTLKDKTVTPPCTAIAEMEVVGATVETGEEAARQKAIQNQEDLAQGLLEFDPETTKYPEALKLFKALGLEAENAKQDTIFPMLVAAKASAEGVTKNQE